jgi:predicted secreted protein
MRHGNGMSPGVISGDDHCGTARHLSIVCRAAEEPAMEELELRTGEQRELTLPGLGTAGYRWRSTVDNADVVRVERVIATPATGEIQPGRSLDERFLLIALASGETMVQFAQARSFEPAKPPLSTRQFRVTVTAGESPNPKS